MQTGTPQGNGHVDSDDMTGRQSTTHQSRGTRRDRGATTGRLSRSLVGALLVFALTACGGDDGDADTPPGGDEGTEEPAGGGGADPEADDATGEDGDLEAIATGLRVSLQAERVDVEGDTIHIHVKESDRVVAGAGMECTVARGVVPEGTPVVVHRDGTESTC